MVSKILNDIYKNSIKKIDKKILNKLLSTLNSY